MKVREKVSWLMGRVQENLFPHVKIQSQVEGG